MKSIITMKRDERGEEEKNVRQLTGEMELEWMRRGNSWNGES